MGTCVMRKYEGMFLVDVAVAASDWDQLVSDIKKILVDRAGAEIISLEKWDERRMCYPIKGSSRGVYILCYFNADPAVISSIERDMRISEQITRVLILNAEAIPENVVSNLTPLAQAQKEAEAAEAKAEADAKAKAEAAEAKAKAKADADAKAEAPAEPEAVTDDTASE